MQKYQEIRGEFVPMRMFKCSGCRAVALPAGAPGPAVAASQALHLMSNCACCCHSPLCQVSCTFWPQLPLSAIAQEAVCQRCKTVRQCRCSQHCRCYCLSCCCPRKLPHIMHFREFLKSMALDIAQAEITHDSDSAIRRASGEARAISSSSILQLHSL